MSSTVHLHPTAELAPRVLLPGDPGRALLLAQELLEQPMMFNHNRGLWGYTGVAADQEPLTIQSTGMGGPSAAIIVFELAELGARRLIRVGTCGGLSSTLELGRLIVAAEAFASDGTSRALGAGETVAATSGLARALAVAAGADADVGPVVSSDLFYGAPEGEEKSWAARGALAVEMETATLFTLAHRLGFEAASLLIVSDLLFPARRRIDADRLKQAERRLGRAALQALA